MQLNRAKLSPQLPIALQLGLTASKSVFSNITQNVGGAKCLRLLPSTLDNGVAGAQVILNHFKP